MRQVGITIYKQARQLYNANTCSHNRILRVFAIRAIATIRMDNSNQSQKDTSMPTPLSLGFDIKYHRCNPSNSSVDSQEQPRRPLVILAGWMGAKERQMKPYLSFYHKHNIDTISFAVGPHHVLFPSQAEKHMELVLKLVCNSINDSRIVISNPNTTSTSKHQIDSKKIHPPSALLFHHFSVGGFLYGQVLLAIQSNPIFQTMIPKMIKGQIFDSPPDYTNISIGISRSIGITGFTEKIVEYLARSYLKFTEESAGKMHKASSHAFHENNIQAPSLWFYSKADPVADWKDCAIVIEKWKGKGIIVEECVWKDTPHIQHGRVDPDRYFNTLRDFLGKNLPL